ncbi:cell division protein FtsQ/DivIB [Hippea jasoniae]|uniref:cell division protein FtsQ/DivIB n=1 Tax=Hippea jasoniae TaxID=944479 RepID=UPI0005566B08|nr:FtsQ-type POTRA domain-containing protein [Hippea jasoniae]
MLDLKDIDKKTSKTSTNRHKLDFIVFIAKLITSVLFVVGIFAVVVYGYKQLSNRYAILKYIDINGNHVIDRNSIVSAILNPNLNNINNYSPQKIYMKLITNPWISSASVSVVYPDTIIVNITEKKPKAIVKTSKSTYIIDSNGSIISSYSKNLHLPENLYTIILKDNRFLKSQDLLKNVLRMYKKLDNVEKINYIEVVSQSYQLVHFKGGLTVSINSFDCPDRAIKHLKEKISYLNSLASKLKEVSICFENKFVLKWKKGVKK